MPKERHGAAHRIKASRKQDDSAHRQLTRAPQGQDRALPWQWNSAGMWVDDQGRAPSADEVEAAGLDPTGRMM
jgi:hypothetical protein